MLTYMEI
jgi:hypothetical protein